MRGLLLLALASYRDIRRAVPQAYSAILATGGVREPYREFVTLAVQYRRLEAKLVAKVQLLENPFEAIAISLGSNVEIFASGLRRDIVCDLRALSDVNLRPLVEPLSSSRTLERSGFSTGR